MTEPKIDTLLKLTPEVTQKFKDMQPKFEQAENTLAALDKIGLDTKELRDKLKWAKDVQKILLESFGS